MAQCNIYAYQTQGAVEVILLNINEGQRDSCLYINTKRLSPFYITYHFTIWYLGTR